MSRAVRASKSRTGGTRPHGCAMVMFRGGSVIIEWSTLPQTMTIPPPSLIPLPPPSHPLSRLPHILTSNFSKVILFTILWNFFATGEGGCDQDSTSTRTQEVVAVSPPSGALDPLKGGIRNRPRSQVFRFFFEGSLFYGERSRECAFLTVLK